MSDGVATIPEAKSIKVNPSAEELYELTEAMPNSRWTEYKNLNVQTKVVARSKGSTYLVLDDPDSSPHQAMSKEEGERIEKMQDAYIAEQPMIRIDGYIGNDPEKRVPVRLFIEESNANIAGMQKALYFDLDDPDTFEPQLMVIYTPNLKAEGYPDDRLIAVNLDKGVTRVMNSDYFGESKKGGLRMWNKLVYDQGGLSLHAGCKVIPVGDEKKVGLIVGLSGTGKTTTTFTKQNNSQPVQDDFVAMWPDGRISATEDGCFAKTFGLNPDDEPTIYGAVTQPGAYLENVSEDDQEKIDFFDTSYTKNGRATFPFAAIDAADAREITKADFLLVLNKNENIIPAVAKLDSTQAAAFFMLGETQGTSAGGADEAGKFLRVPGTNPFFPMENDLQGNRFLELMQDSPFDVYLMNTGRVGGGAEDDRSKKVRIQHSSAIVKGIAEGTIEWEPDPDFGYQIASSVPGIDSADAGVLCPKKLYGEKGRADEYEKLVSRFKQERSEFLKQFPALSEEIVQSVG